MIKYIREHGKLFEITGFRNSQIANVKRFMDTLTKELPVDTEVQMFDADLIATWQHLFFAVLNALTAFKNKRNLSRSIGVETALYASSQRQIRKALSLIGLAPDSNNVAVIIIGKKIASIEAVKLLIEKKLNSKLDDAVLDLSDSKIKRIISAFQISSAEFNAVSSRDNYNQAVIDLVIERVALLSTRF
jgi:tRNA threonylcarbamoyladenosine modification (KEOPS) complex Cgi121 subunit